MPQGQIRESKRRICEHSKFSFRVPPNVSNKIFL